MASDINLGTGKSMFLANSFNLAEVGTLSLEFLTANRAAHYYKNMTSTTGHIYDETAASGPNLGGIENPFSLEYSGVAPDGATPSALIPITFLSFG